MKTLDLLLDDLFDGRPHALRPAMDQWLSSSRRFAGFVENNRDKIRKKLRLKQALAEAADLQWELQVAFLLHNNKRFTVHYEAYTRAQPFGPDFRVQYTTSVDFNVEVTRMRSAIAGDDREGRHVMRNHRARGDDRKGMGRRGLRRRRGRHVRAVLAFLIDVRRRFRP